MIFKETFKTQLKDIGKNNYIKNKSILEIFENIGTYHSDLAGYGPNDIERVRVSWVLLDWKLKVIKRPKYGQTLNVNTWGRTMKKFYTYRDFEMFDEHNNLCAIGTSKWTLVNIDTGKLEKLSEEVFEKYQIESKSVFNEEELDKLKELDNFSSEIEYKVSRRDIDINGHMHNLYYLDLAYDALPKEVFEQRPFNNVRIQYKKEVKFGNILKCKYSCVDSQHVVSIYNEDNGKLSAIVILN